MYVNLGGMIYVAALYRTAYKLFDVPIKKQSKSSSNCQIVRGIGMGMIPVDHLQRVSELLGSFQTFLLLAVKGTLHTVNYTGQDYCGLPHIDLGSYAQANDNFSAWSMFSVDCISQYQCEQEMLSTDKK